MSIINTVPDTGGGCDCDCAGECCELNYPNPLVAVVSGITGPDSCTSLNGTYNLTPDSVLTARGNVCNPGTQVWSVVPGYAVFADGPPNTIQALFCPPMSFFGGGTGMLFNVFYFDDEGEPHGVGFRGNYDCTTGLINWINQPDLSEFCDGSGASMSLNILPGIFEGCCLLCNTDTSPPSVPPVATIPLYRHSDSGDAGNDLSPCTDEGGDMDVSCPCLDHNLELSYVEGSAANAGQCQWTGTAIETCNGVDTTVTYTLTQRPAGYGGLGVAAYWLASTGSCSGDFEDNLELISCNPPTFGTRVGQFSTEEDANPCGCPLCPSSGGGWLGETIYWEVGG